MYSTNSLNFTTFFVITLVVFSHCDLIISPNVFLIFLLGVQTLEDAFYLIL